MSKDIKVYFVTEGNSEVGFGHLNRCISLYYGFEEQSINSSLIINGDDTIKEIIREKNYYLFNWLKNKEKLYNKIIGSDIVIVDSYLADYSIYEKISNLAKIPVFIDDTLRLDYPPGVIINTTINKKFKKQAEKDNKIYLLGTEFCMLKKEFWDVPIKQINKEIKNILITFGGTDEKNLTPRLLKDLKSYFPDLKKNVIIGKGYHNISEIEDLKDQKCNLIYFPTSEEMKNIMLESDIAITAGGQTIYELATVGVPAITIATADNQINNVESCAELGINYHAGWWEDKNIYDTILNKILKLKDIEIRKEMISLGRKYIKSDGSRKIVDFLIKLSYRKKMFN